MDDSCKESSIAQNAEKIRQEISQNKARLLLATYKFSDSCLKTLKKHGILKAYDGISRLGAALNSHYAEKYKDKKVIAIMLNGYELEQKHLGDVPKRLENAGFDIFYIVALTSRWCGDICEKLLQKQKPFLLAEYDFLEQFDFFPMLLEQADWLKPNPKVRSLKLFTSMDEVPQRAYTPRDYQESVNLAHLQASYLNIHSKTHFERLAVMQAYFHTFPRAQQEARFVCGGYPSIEKQAADFGEVDYSIKRDSVIFISAYINLYEIERAKKLMSAALNAGYRVVFKTCPPHLECLASEQKLQEFFKDNSNFVFYTEPRLSRDEMQRALCFVEASSSMCYSAPVISKRPCIMPYPSKARLAASQMPDFLEKDDGFFHPSLHIRIFEDDEESTLIAHLRELEKIEVQKEWEAKIKDYCQNDLYNFGKSAEYIAQWICEWYENREILS